MPLPWGELTWFRRIGDPSGPFMNQDEADRTGRYAVGRPDGRNRPSDIPPSRQDCARRWPRLTAAIMAAEGLTFDEATFALSMYVQGQSGQFLWKPSRDYIDRGVQKYFGRWPDGFKSQDLELRRHWRKVAIELRQLVFVRLYPPAK